MQTKAEDSSKSNGAKHSLLRKQK